MHCCQSRPPLLFQPTISLQTMHPIPVCCLVLTYFPSVCLPFPAVFLQVLGPDVEYIISRAQAIQAGADSPVLTAEHLQKAISSLPGGDGAGGADGGLTKEDLEATMKQMLMVSVVWAGHCS
jgi:hypothetical protein